MLVEGKRKEGAKASFVCRISRVRGRGGGGGERMVRVCDSLNFLLALCDLQGGRDTAARQNG